MILFVNVIVTDVRNQGYFYDRYGLPFYNRFDIFKYSLASLSALNKHWSKIVIFCELDGQYSHKWDELEYYLGNLFDGIELKTYRRRNLMQKEWQEAYEKELAPVQDNLIWYHGNDDHIFIDYNLDCIDNILELMYYDCTPFATCVYSHWPEYIKFSASNNAYNAGPAAVFNSHNTDAIHIVSKPLFKHWFWGYDWTEPITRTDFIKFRQKIDMKCYVPLRELVRHFDGYSHSMYLPACCPPLHMPEGFFKRNIKITYLGEERKPGWTLINPLLPYRTVDGNGADFRYKIDELPLFWQDRVKKIETIKHYPEKAIRDARLAEKSAIFSAAWTDKWMTTLPWEWCLPWLDIKPKTLKIL